MKMNALLATLMLVFALSANAAIIETEPNNTMATANPIAVTDVDMGVLSLGNSTDVDFFAINLDANDVITVTTTPFQTAFTVPDTYLGLFDSTGAELVTDDNSGPGMGSMVYYVANAGQYYIGVTGTGDTGFNGNDGKGHDQIGKYIMSVSVVAVPEPLTLSFLALSTLCLVCRKK